MPYDNHPGYALKSKDGYYASLGHGAYGPDDAEYAEIFSTQKEAEKCLLTIINNGEFEVIEAWEPLIAKLNNEIKELKKANSFSPQKIIEIQDSLDQFQTSLNELKQIFE